MFAPVKLPLYLDREFGLFWMTTWLKCGACGHRFKVRFVMGMQQFLPCPSCEHPEELGDSVMSGPFYWPERN